MTTFIPGRLLLNKQKIDWRIAIWYAALLTLVVLISAVAFAAVNAGSPMLAEMRIQNAVNALNQAGLTTERHQAQRELESAGEQAVPPLIVALRSEDAVLRRNAAEMLGYIGSPQALSALRYALISDPTPQVRRNAAWALGEINDWSALADLQQAAVLDQNSSVRQTAADSIARVRTRLAQMAGVNEQELSAFAVASGNSSIAYVATRRELVSTHDSGKTWQTVTGALPSLVTTLAVSPTDPQVLYANADGLGLFTSMDGGGTWTAANIGLGVMPGARFTVTAIAIDSADPQRIFVTTGVWIGTSHVEFYPIAVMRTVNGGATWQVYEKSSNVYPITRLAIAGERLYALAGNQNVPTEIQPRTP